jgi:thiosulfate/3-mercaptopyruvate sulfurtransferase
MSALGSRPGRPLITAAELAAALREPPPPVVLDVRWRLGGPPGAESYRAGHIPGAVFADLDRDLAGPPGGRGGRHPLPEAGAFQAAMRRAGISADRLVVVYDDADSTAAARAWWTLRYFGHRDVRVLDGGYRAWTAAGEPVSAAAVPPALGRFTAVAGGMPVLDAAGAARLARSGVLLDARAGERYRGELEPVDPVAGHIPGAVSAPTAQNVGADGTFRPAAELRARFAGLGMGAGVRGAAAGVPGDAAGEPAWPGEGGAAGGTGVAGGPGEVGAYCGSGVTAAHEVLALALAGIPAALYADSWSGWVTDPARPVATGPGPG